MKDPVWRAAILFGLAGCAGGPPELRSLVIEVANVSDDTTWVDAEGAVDLGLAPGLVTVATVGGWLVTSGSAASPELEALAEAGDPAAALTRAQALDTVVAAVVVGDTDNPTYAQGPILPGTSLRRAVLVDEVAIAEGVLELAMMLGASNDTFLATPEGGVPLAGVGTQPTSLEGLGWWDAGTEANEPLGRGDHQPGVAPGVDSGVPEDGTVHAAPGPLPAVGDVVEVRAWLEWLPEPYEG